MLRSLVVALAATAAVVIGGNARAASMSAPAAMRTAADSLKITENVQFFWSGHNYCWYDDGWNGPGWYWCDMYLQSGIGWGGGYGGHHWRGGHPHSYYQGGAAVMPAESRSGGGAGSFRRSLVAVSAWSGHSCGGGGQGGHVGGGGGRQGGGGGGGGGKGGRRQGRRKKVMLLIVKRE